MEKTNSGNFQIVEKCLKKLSEEIKEGDLITSESDLKCNLYGELKNHFKGDLFIECKGRKYPKIVTEMAYGNTRSQEDNFADIVIVNERDLYIYKNGEFRMQDKIVESLVIELKFADWHTNTAKENKIWDDCEKILHSDKVSNACVVLVDIEDKDCLKDVNLENLKDDLIREFKDKLQRTNLVFYYITKREGLVKVEPLKEIEEKRSIIHL